MLDTHKPNFSILQKVQKFLDFFLHIFIKFAAFLKSTNNYGKYDRSQIANKRNIGKERLE